MYAIRSYYDRVDEQANDDRRRREQHIVQEAGRAGQPAALAELGEVGSGEDTDLV